MELDPDSALINFIARYLADREAGRARDLSEYLRDYKGSESAITREYERLATRAVASPPAVADLERVGPYVLERELGRGGQGTVWLARDPRLERRVALKLVPCSPLFEDLAPRFRREAQMASRLEHRGICAVYDVGSDGRVAWIAMRFVEGETLAAVLAADPNRSRLTLDARMELIEQAARALHIAHEAGVVHRDVKPGNIMVTPAGEPVVLDFGIARDDQVGAPLTLGGQALGTPAYMSPEQLRENASAVDRRTDVWSLGVTLYEAATGRRPFEAPTRETLVRAVLESEPPDPRSLQRAVSTDLAVVLATALSKEPDRRYRTALDFAEDLRRLREHEPILARPAGPTVRLSRWARRNPALAASLCALGLVLATALATSLQLLSQTRRSLADVTRLADQRLVRQQLASAAQLWPAVPEQRAKFEQWLTDAGVLLSRRGLHQAALEGLRARHASSATVAAMPGEAASTDAWLDELLTQLLADLDALAASVKSVEARARWADDIDRVTIDEPRAAWDEAIARVAADARYGGLALVPQRGLVPIGRDPQSGFEEFVHLESGSAPQRDPESGKVAMTEGMGIVLVLLPACTTHIGCERPSDARPPGSPHADPFAGDFDGPVQEVVLDAFFLSKYELTQAQWVRHEGTNPSYFQKGGQHVKGERAGLHPVEQVSWTDAQRACAELDLELPTEAQWEYGARGGSSTPWWCGDEQSSIAGCGNLADRHAKEHGGAENWIYAEWLDDGFTTHAPVGSYRANDFGLHDTLGNVVELCRDTWETWSEVAPPRAGDGLHVGDELLRCTRGGGFTDDALPARSAARAGVPVYVSAPYVGLRPSRPVRR